MSFITSILSTVGSVLFKALINRWLDKDPEKEQLKNAIKAKQHEIQVISAPPRDESVVDDILLARARERDKNK